KTTSVIVMTDGAATSPDKLAQELTSFNNTFFNFPVVTFALGVGSLINVTQLIEIAGAPERVTLVSDFSSLTQVFVDQFLTSTFCTPGPSKVCSGGLLKHAIVYSMVLIAIVHTIFFAH